MSYCMTTGGVAAQAADAIDVHLVVRASIRVDGQSGRAKAQILHVAAIGRLQHIQSGIHGRLGCAP
jgi:hypothetical protein